MRSGASKTDGSAENDEVPMLLDTHSHPLHICMDVELPPFSVRNRSASMFGTPYSMDSFRSEDHLVSHTGPLTSKRTPSMNGPLYSNQKPANIFVPMKGPTTANVLALEHPSVDGTDQKDSPSGNSGTNEHLLRSGKLGMCNDPYCTTCPMFLTEPAITKPPSESDTRRERKGWARRHFSFLRSFVTDIKNPHMEFVQRWNKFFVISCLVAIFVDPLFFLVLYANKEYKCIVLDWHMAKTITVVRSLTDLIYLVHMLLQFRLAYAPDSSVEGAGGLIDQPTTIARHYLRSYFFIDLFVVLPLPQIMILFVLPKYVGSSTNFAKNLLRITVLLQYIPRIVRCLPLLAGRRSPSGFIFETAWANFVINLLMFVLAGHVVGSFWYLFGVQRVNQCLRNVCAVSEMKCEKFIDCEYSENTSWNGWRNYENASICFNKDGDFSYGIYKEAVKISTNRSIFVRYIYSLFWGFQQISTLAGNLVPSDFVWEVLFTMAIIGSGLFLFALLIGNMQNFLQALGRRRSEMQLRRRDVEKWMNHRHLPEAVRRKVKQSERYRWEVTRGLKEEILMENLPEDLQREIRHHLCRFIKKIRIFALMDGPILDAIFERLKQKTYIKESRILYYGGPVDKMVFIVRGKLESERADGNKAQLSEGSVIGEELLALCLKQTTVNKDEREFRFPRQQLISYRTVTCLTNVIAFSLKAADLEEVTTFYAAFLRKPRVQAALRYESSYWRGLAATHIQVAWRYRMKR